MKIEFKNTDKLIPYINNARTHSDEQVQQIAASIKEFGFTNPILLDEENGIIAGHGRLRGAQLLSLNEVPTITLSGLTEAQKKAYVIADNKISLNAGWDEELLKIEIESLQDFDFDLDVLGFDDEELEGLLGDYEEGKTNEMEEWSGMPDFSQKDTTSKRHIIVHFEDDVDAESFFSLIGQTDTGKTKSIWHPYKQQRETESKRYG